MSIYSDSEILWYFNCDSITDGQSPTKGAGTVSMWGDVASVAGGLGNAVSIVAGNANFTTQSASNVNWGIGSIGFYFRCTAITSQNYTIFYQDPNQEVTPYWSFHLASGTFYFRYKNTSITVSGLAINTTYFLSFSWDGTLNKAAYRIDGGSWSETTGLSGSNPANDYLCYGQCDSNTPYYWIDQIIIANTYQKDLYALRNDDGSAGGATLDQEGFRFRNDDGDEASATYAADQDTGMTAPAGENRRLRFIVNATGDPGAKTFQLEYKKSTESEWLKVV